MPKRSSKKFELQVYLKLFPLTDVDVLGDDLSHLLLGVLVLLDDLLQQLVQATNGLVVLLDRIGKDEHLSLQTSRFVRDQLHNKILYLGLFVLMLELEALLAEVLYSDEVAALL